MADVYVTGHRNPDTDSIVASIAYVYLRNATGDRNYKAVRIGTINDETQKLLDYFAFKAPPLVKNMRTQVRDLDFDRPPAFNSSVTMDLALRTMQEDKLNVVPVTDEEGKLRGMLSIGDIAAYDIQTMNENRVDDLPLFNLLSVLEGRLVNEYHVTRDLIGGELFITLPQNYEDQALTNPDAILICGNQPELVERAVAAKVSTIILCRADVKNAWADVSGDTVLISTPLSARRVSRIIYQALPVGRISTKGEIVAFHLDDYLDDVRETLLESRYRSYPILDENEKVVGTLSRYHLLRPKRKQVVLVDHNEAAQSVVGLDQVDILEIIDHHRLADIQTGQPIHVRNEPVGSTNTILTSMYQESGVVPPPKIAGLMAGAILSDTVLFKSPTCTKKDIAMAERLARIANISLDELSKSLFSYNLDKDPETLLRTDYKQFHISGQNLAVSQITCDDSAQLLDRAEEFLEVMRRLKKLDDFDLVILMITDVLQEGSHLLYVGSDDIIQQAFGVAPKNSHIFLPKVMSRKKQIIPMLTALWG